MRLPLFLRPQQNYRSRHKPSSVIDITCFGSSANALITGVAGSVYRLNAAEKVAIYSLIGSRRWYRPHRQQGDIGRDPSPLRDERLYVQSASAIRRPAGNRLGRLWSSPRCLSSHRNQSPGRASRSAAPVMAHPYPKTATRTAIHCRRAQS